MARKPKALGKLYFAHPVWTYNTADEAMALDELYRQCGEDGLFAGHDVLNPNAPEHQEGYRARGWQYFDDLVGSCDALVMWVGPTPYPLEGYPAGIWAEAHHMTVLGRQVWELTSDWDLHRLTEHDADEGKHSTWFHGTRPLTVNETRKMRDLVWALQAGTNVLLAAQENMNLRGIMGGEAADLIDKALDKAHRVDFPRLKR
jgi:hypothetical protein